MNFITTTSKYKSLLLYNLNCSQGGVANRKNRQQSYTGRLVKYCLYAWGSPVLLVLVCVIADHAKKGSIGYGKCYTLEFETQFLIYINDVRILNVH